MRAHWGLLESVGLEGSPFKGAAGKPMNDHIVRPFETHAGESLIDSFRPP